MPATRPFLLLAATTLAGTLAAQQPTYVANEAPRLPAARAWRVGPVLMQAGHAEDPNGLELSRVTGALRLEDGRIVVANAASNELIFLRRDGREELRAGRSGDGPGEFRYISALGVLPSGEVWASDRTQRVVHTFDGAGRYQRTISLKRVTIPGDATPAGVLPDGRFVLRSVMSPVGGSPVGFDSTDVVVLDPVTERPVTVARVPKTNTGNPMGSLMFGEPLILAVAPSGIWWGYGDTYRIHRLDASGTLVGGTTRRITPAAFSTRLWGEYVETRVAASRAAGRSQDQIQRLRGQMANLKRPDRIPAFSDAEVDVLDNLWVAGFEIPGVLEPEWDVFNPAGAWLTSLQLPQGFRPMHIGADWILGVQRDEDGVESVALRRLIKPT